MVGYVVLVEVFPFLFFLDFAFSSESMGVFVLAGVGVSVLRVFNIHAFIYLLILILNWKLNPPLRTCGPHIRAEAVINFFEASVIHFAPIWDSIQSCHEIRGSDHNSISTIHVHEVAQSNNEGSGNVNKLSAAEYCKMPDSNPDPGIKEIGFENALISHTDQTDVHGWGSHNKPNSVSNESEAMNQFFDDREEVSVNIYPNPFRDHATIKVDMTGQKDLSMNIVDMTGKTIEVLQISDKKTILDRARLNSGIYFFYLIGNGENIFSGKLIIE